MGDAALRSQTQSQAYTKTALVICKFKCCLLDQAELSPFALILLLNDSLTKVLLKVPNPGSNSSRHGEYTKSPVCHGTHVPRCTVALNDAQNMAYLGMNHFVYAQKCSLNSHIFLVRPDGAPLFNYLLCKSCSMPWHVSQLALLPNCFYPRNYHTRTVLPGTTSQYSERSVRTQQRFPSCIGSTLIFSRDSELAWCPTSSDASAI